MTTELTVPRGVRWGLTSVVAVCLAILVGLGTWQVQRLGWKTRLLAQIDALRTAPAEPIEIALRHLDQGGDLDYVRVQGQCPALEQLPTIRLHAIRDGVLGYRLIAACPVEGGPYRSVLVDRGFVSREQADQVVPGATVLDGPIVGVLRKGDAKSVFAPADRPDLRLWYSRNIPAMARMLGAASPAPLFLTLEKPAPKAFGPTPAPLPTDIPNNHLGYAITWFGLAAALLSVYIAMLRRDRRT